MERTPIVDIDGFDYNLIKNARRLSRRKGNPGTTNHWYYKDLVCAFDIETTYLEEIDRSIMYLWQFQFDEYYTIMGRTWREYQEFSRRLCRYLSGDERLYIAVHNLSFEFQFLAGIQEVENKDIFSVKPRRVLSYRSNFNKFEYNCTYLHSNMSLDKYCKQMETDHQKQSGEEFDYSKIRYPWTELTPFEIKYGQYDVLALVEAVKNDLEKGGDTLYTLPKTSTGYVRRDIKNALKKSHYNVKEILPDYTTYQYCREAFRGGNTHANRFYSNRILGAMKSYDRKSSYPEVIMTKKYPMTKFMEVESPTLDDVLRLIYKRNKALLIRVRIWGIRLKHIWWPVPYLSESKCRKIKKKVIDNGRILSANYIETTLTDIDLKIILDEYEYTHIEVQGALCADYGYLPKPIRDCTIEYFKKKCELDGVPGEEYYYFKSKEKQNSIYGMFAQDPVKQDILYDDGGWDEASDPERDLLDKSNSRAFLAYQWGCWVTAWARWELEQGIKIAGCYCVYVDTDSVKYLDMPDISWDEYNSAKRREAEYHGAYADARGRRFFLGVFEKEKDIIRFKTMGAKKYAYECDDGLHITVAGVRKEEGAEDLMEAGGLEAFKEGFIFKHGGAEARYYDGPPEIYKIDGRDLVVSKCVSIIHHEYKLGITGEYERILKGLIIEQY